MKSDTQIKKTIGTLTTEELLDAARSAAVAEAGLPGRGGDYDTMAGWCDRLRISTPVLKRLMTMLGEEVERRPGHVLRPSGPYRCNLIYSKKMGEMAKDLGN